MTYALTENAPKTAVIHHLPSGDYNVSEYGSAEAAVAAIILKSSGVSPAELKANIKEYTQDEVLVQAEKAAWPVELGFVYSVESEEEMLDLLDPHGPIRG